VWRKKEVVEELKNNSNTNNFNHDPQNIKSNTEKNPEYLPKDEKDKVKSNDMKDNQKSESMN